jgi:acetolactate synthase-1/2/3 large subunit
MTEIRPTPDYVKVAEAHGGCRNGSRIRLLLGPALQRALDAVASGKAFLLDVITLP